MALKHWQVGLHIQQDKVAIVALQRDRARWRLCRWWLIPLESGGAEYGDVLPSEALLSALRDWRKELPYYHDIHLAFPTGRTLQKTLPAPAVVLREPEQARWVSSAMAQSLAMASDTLCFDYAEDYAHQRWAVTAAQHADIEQLRALAETLRLHVTAITPEACALQRLLPWVTAPACALAWSDGLQWLWATSHGWGCVAHRDAPGLSELAVRLNLEETQLMLCHRFDPWQAVTRRQPPLPDEDDAFTVAIALAMGEVH